MMTRNYENGAYGSLGPASSPSPEEFRLKNVEARILEAESAGKAPGGGSSAIPFPEAFTVYLGSDGWRVFSEPGLPLVIVAGKAVDVVGADSAVSVPADPLYVEIEDRSGVAYAELKSGTEGTIPEASGETVRIAAVPVATIRSGTPVQQYHKGVVVIGGKGGSGVPVMFDPVFGEDGSLVAVYPGLVPVGRQFFWVTPTVEASSGGAPAADEILYCIRLVLGGGSSGIFCSSATVVRESPGQDVRNSAPSTTLLPLYCTSGGAITLDCRHVLSMPVRE